MNDSMQINIYFFISSGSLLDGIAHHGADEDMEAITNIHHGNIKIAARMTSHNLVCPMIADMIIHHGLMLGSSYTKGKIRWCLACICQDWCQRRGKTTWLVLFLLLLL
jgi:hypothetical protein